MKPTRIERAELIRKIEEQRTAAGLSYAALGDRAGVDPSQVSRICRGEFVTFGANVVRICMMLGVRVPGGRTRITSGRPADPNWDKLERSMRRAWDNTSAGADRLAKVIAAVGEITRP
jgi:hypothetical protein